MLRIPCNGVYIAVVFFSSSSIVFYIFFFFSPPVFVFTGTKCAAKRLLRFRPRAAARSTLDVIGDWSKIHFYEISDCRYFLPAVFITVASKKKSGEEGGREERKKEKIVGKIFDKKE